MKHFDALVIGGGILGCFAARNLRRWQISTLLAEAADDVCTGITRANSAIVYPGYDNRPGSRKAQMTVRGNAGFDTLCRELDVPFSRCGSLLVSYDEPSAEKLLRKYRHGLDNGVPGLRLLTGTEAEEMEPMLQTGVVSALFAPTTGTVSPWGLGIAAWENARHNGAETSLNTKVLSITPQTGGYLVQTTAGDLSCRVILNCAGLSADAVQALVYPTPIRLHLDSAEYLVLDEHAPKPSRVIFHQASSCGKGITAIPCVEGNLLLSGVRQPLTEPFATTEAGLQALHTAAKALLPQLDLSSVIRSFGAVRPNPETADGSSFPDFCIENPGPGFYSLLGIKTPGITCANELTMHLALETAAYLKAPENPDFDPIRRGIRPTASINYDELDGLIRENPDYGEIICQCRHITKGEVLEAIARGAKTCEAVKRRIGTAMGVCQGSRCDIRIQEILRQAGYPPCYEIK